MGFYLKLWVENDLLQKKRLKAVDIIIKNKNKMLLGTVDIIIK